MGKTIKREHTGRLGGQQEKEKERKEGEMEEKWLGKKEGGTVVFSTTLCEREKRVCKAQKLRSTGRCFSASPSGLCLKYYV